ncbi:MAG TPA: hypothetical protein VJ803_08055 [Gemmatimonadaceae bacterium]|nr:hypothetical protein [Gemmatimonadaceae bacterium]
MSDQPTCGKGLAANAALPAKTGALITSIAEVLVVHMRALDLTDERSREEYRAYEHLATALRLAGRQLSAIGDEMTGYRDLPMGRHDMTSMTVPAVRDSFREFIEREQELLVLLQGRIAEDQHLLEQMAATAR